MSKTESLRSRMQNLEGKRVLVAGFARSGRAAAEFLQKRGAVVTVSDTRPPWSFASEIPDLLAHKVGLEFGQHGSDTFVRQDLIVASPGVPWDLPALAAARERGVPVVAEVEAASWFLKGSLVGVTGSNGKTTTTALLGRILQESGFQTLVGGNIGTPLISMVEQSTPESIAVVELSSFQLEGTDSMNPQVAVMLNITPNHLDRHPSFESYVEAKARILRNQTESDYAVLNADDSAVTGLSERGLGRKILFSRTQDLGEGLLISEGQVVYRVGHLQRDLFSPGNVKLRGAFNLENVLAASAAACILGADFDAIAKAVREFRGVEHRLEYAGDVLGVAFYNDSKATSVDATVKALGAFDHGIHLILGGKDKGAPYAPLIPLLKNRVREVLLIGAAAERIGLELAGAVDLVPAGDLETAVRKAFSRARPGDVILLSPACASFDQFQDFEERGRKFKQIVEGLAQEGHVARLRRTWVGGESRSRPTQAAPGTGIVAKTVETEREPFQLSPPPSAPTQSGGAEPPPAVSIPATPAPSTVAVAPARSPERILRAEVSQATRAQSPAGFSEPAPATKVEPPVVGAETSEVAEFEVRAILPESSRPAREPESVLRVEVSKAQEEEVPAILPETTAPVRVPVPSPNIAPRPVRTAPEPAEVHQGSPERIYVYELEAEERRPMETDEAFALDDVVLDRGTGSILDLDLKPHPRREASAHSDEPLFFEITDAAAPSGASGSDRENPAAAASHNSRTAAGEEQDRERRDRKHAKIHAEEGSK